MSAPPFFQSVGRGDLKFWGEDNRPTVAVWEGFIGIGAGAVVEKDWQVEGLGGLVQVKEKRRRASRWKINLLKPQQAYKS